MDDGGASACSMILFFLLLFIEAVLSGFGKPIYWVLFLAKMGSTVSGMVFGMVAISRGKRNRVGRACAGSCDSLFNVYFAYF